MPDYEKMYHKMLDASTDAQRLVEMVLLMMKMIQASETGALDKALTMLKSAQVECEDIYIETAEESNAR